MLSIFRLVRAFSKTLPINSVKITDNRKIETFFRKYTYFANQNRNLPVKISLEIELESYISASEYIEFLFCLNSSNNSFSELIPGLIRKLEENPLITPEAFTNLLLLIRQKKIQMDLILENSIFQTFLRLNKQIRIGDISTIAYFINSKDLNTINEKVYIELEKMSVLNMDKFDTDQIIIILRVFSKIIYKYPSDIHVKFEQKIANGIKLMSWESIGYLLVMYAGIPRTHHFLDLAKAVNNKILEEQTVFYNPESQSFIQTLHFFSKFRGFNEINELIPKYIPEITKKMIESPASLGMFFLSILRKPPSNEYKKYILREIIKNADTLEEFRKKKIIIAMAEDPNTEFWDNVHKLGVYWNKNETLFIKKEEAVLIQHGLIRD